ncbi:MAG: FRG domain-containing protein, partial [Deinococcota bacterium]|nr:FRG domain-containing protein [Deinococcota bacterium]
LLSTSLMRLEGPYAEMEAHLLRNFRKYAHGGVVDGNSVWHWLALAQHHGLPTRLLDWTFSPFVAMHFATSNPQKLKSDGVIWAVAYEHVHGHLPAPLAQELHDEGSSVFTVDMLAKHAQSLQEFSELDEEPFLLFLEPPAMDERIVNQYALFSCPSTAQLNLSDYLRDRPEFYRKIIIPAELKWEIRDKFDQANITEPVLFPGLDGLSRWLARSYTSDASGLPSCATVKKSSKCCLGKHLFYTNRRGIKGLAAKLVGKDSQKTSREYLGRPKWNSLNELLSVTDSF